MLGEAKLVSKQHPGRGISMDKNPCNQRANHTLSKKESGIDQTEEKNIAV